MRHGRPILPPGLWPRQTVLRLALLGLPALLSPRTAPAQTSPDQTALGQAAPAAATPLRLSWDEPNHPSGIYYVKDDATLTVLVDNPGPTPTEVTGEIIFGLRTAGPPGTGDLKILSVTPIADATVGAGQRARLPLHVTFGAAGSYELRWHHGQTTDPISASNRPLHPPASSAGLECIFAPRTVMIGGSPTSDDAPWIAPLPPAAVRHPGLLKDYALQTTVRHFLIDERFSYDPVRNVGLGFGAATGGTQKDIDALLAEAADSKIKLILRVGIPVDNAAPADKSVAAFRAYIQDAIRRSQGALGAIAMMPVVETRTLPPGQARGFLAFYMAGVEAARQTDKRVTLLGAGSARLTSECLDPKLAAYIDALAISDAVDEPPAAAQFLQKAGAKKPLWLLPPMAGQPSTPPAAGLAAGAAQVAVPGPEIDHGVTAHLLGGAVFLERLQITVPTADPTEPTASNLPFVAVFQGDGYGVAAIAGFSAGTDLDALYPLLARTRTEVVPAKADDSPAYPHLEVGDDSQAMRVVDAEGAPVDCRSGDTVNVPAADKVVYLLEGGTAEDLAGSLRVANLRRLPVFEPVLRATAQGLTVRLHNISTHGLAGTVRVIRTPPAQPAEVLGEADFNTIPPDKALELPLRAPAAPPAAVGGPLVIEITTLGSHSLVQRTAAPRELAGN